MPGRADQKTMGWRYSFALISSTYGMLVFAIAAGAGFLKFAVTADLFRTLHTATSLPPLQPA
jgi:hypothetical protein